MLPPRVPYRMLLAPMATQPLTKGNVTLLLVDPQHFTTSRDQGLGKLARDRGVALEFEEYFAQADAAIRNMVRLLATCRKQGIPTIYTILNCQRSDRCDLSRQLSASRLPIPVGSPAQESNMPVSYRLS